MSGVIQIWWISDGKPGHENQSLGLADALARHASCKIHRISIAGKRGFFARIHAARQAASGLPEPDFIIAAGHSTHAPLLWLSWKYSARSILLMRPSLPMAFFDLVIAPDHDFEKPPRTDHVILTRGALNRVVPSDGPRDGKLILIGGPSKTHGWDEETLLGMLEKITASGGWTLTDSRRSPDGFMERARLRLPGVSFHPHGETGPGWLPGQLGQAKEAWVTEDSVSMIYEALSSGANVGVLDVPGKKENTRVLTGLRQLADDGYLTPFARWQSSQAMPPPPETLREADRCAELVLRRGL